MAETKTARERLREHLAANDYRPEVPPGPEWKWLLDELDNMGARIEGLETRTRTFETLIGPSFDAHDEWEEHEDTDARSAAIAVKEYYNPDDDELPVWVREPGGEAELWLVEKVSSHVATKQKRTGS